MPLRGCDAATVDCRARRCVVRVDVRLVRRERLPPVLGTSKRRERSTPARRTAVITDLLFFIALPAAIVGFCTGAFLMTLLLMPRERVLVLRRRVDRTT